jgi:RNA polymerase sigma factor (TIGR02999 family)
LSATRNDITLLLSRIEGGHSDAMDELMRVVYDDLERMAASHLRQQFGDRVGQLTLEPSALVNESFLQLIKQRKGFDNRGQFFAIATKIMLRVLMDYRRSRSALKRGGAASRITLSMASGQLADRAALDDLIELEDLSAALERLEALDARKADVVKMRVIWGMTVAEIADAMDISTNTVDRDWKFAKAWIADELGLSPRQD